MPRDKYVLGSRGGIEGLLDVNRGAQKLCVVIFVKKADSNNFGFVIFFQIG